VSGGEIKILISKSYLLMVLNEQKGKRYIRGDLSLGFAGSLLMDLFLLGKIALSKNTIEIINSRPTGNEYLNQVLEIIALAKRKQTLKVWVITLNRKYKNYYYLYSDLMEQQGILRREIRPFLGFRLYYLQKPEIKSQLLEEICSIVNDNKESNINIICLLILLDVSKLLKKYMSRDLRRKARNRIETILDSEQLDPLSREMILKIKEVIWSLGGTPSVYAV